MMDSRCSTKGYRDVVAIELASNGAADLALVMHYVGHNQILHDQCMAVSDFLSA